MSMFHKLFHQEVFTVSIFKRIAPCIVLSALVYIPAFLAFLGQASAGSNAQATVTIDLIANGGVGNQTDDGVRSGVVAGQGTKIAVEVFAKGVTTSLRAMNIEFDFKAEELRLDKVENSAFLFDIPDPTGVNFVALAPVTLPQSGFIGRAEFSTVLDVRDREFHLGIKKVMLLESSSLSDEIAPEAMAMLSTISFNTTVSGNPGDFDADGRVGIADFLAFVEVFGKSSSDVGYDVRMDFDADGRVGIADFLAFVNVFGSEGEDGGGSGGGGSGGIGVQFQDCDECPVMVEVPTGSFIMGAPPTEAVLYNHDALPEGPPHRVEINYPLAVGIYEVTHRQFAQFVTETGYDPSSEPDLRGIRNECFTYEGSWRHRSGRGWENPGFSSPDNYPVVCVGRNDIQAYVRWLANKTGRPYRLLSESEWEYVARAGTTTPYHFGDTITHDKAKFWRGGTFSPTQVGSYPSNDFGLYDVSGNVWEWVEDCYNRDYVGAPADGSAWGSGDCSNRMIRGGSWALGPLPNHVGGMRSAARHAFNYRSSQIGFRVALDLGGEGGAGN